MYLEASPATARSTRCATFPRLAVLHGFPLNLCVARSVWEPCRTGRPVNFARQISGALWRDVTWKPYLWPRKWRQRKTLFSVVVCKFAFGCTDADCTTSTSLESVAEIYKTIKTFLKMNGARLQIVDRRLVRHDKRVCSAFIVNALQCTIKAVHSHVLNLESTILRCVCIFWPIRSFI